jgi:hypothetical protein
MVLPIPSYCPPCPGNRKQTFEAFAALVAILFEFCLTRSASCAISWAVLAKRQARWAKTRLPSCRVVAIPASFPKWFKPNCPISSKALVSSRGPLAEMGKYNVFPSVLLRDSEKRRNLNRSKRKNLNTHRPYYPQFIPRRGLESGTARVFVSGIAHNPEPSPYSGLPR